MNGPRLTCFHLDRRKLARKIPQVTVSILAAMQPSHTRIRLESSRHRVTWRGTLISFARQNSLTPGQMVNLQEQLEEKGEAALTAYGEKRYTLRKN